MNTHITIPLTNSRPLRVTKALWPLVAKASDDRDHNNQEKFRRAYIRVRIHATPVEKGKGTLPYYGIDKEGAQEMRIHKDTRCIVQAWTESSWQGEDGSSAAYICTLDEAADTIRAAAEEAGCPQLIWDATADLPPIDLIEKDPTIEELEAMLNTLKNNQQAGGAA